MREKMMHIFENVFKDTKDCHLFYAPGRVNLIGEYTDFNGGHVLPCALTIGTYAVVRLRDDNRCRWYSENFSQLGVIETTLDALAYDKGHDWANYPKGIVQTFLEEGKVFNKGWDIAFYGNIPNGAGLSSSASIEVLMAVVLKELFALKDTMEEMVELAQRAENNYIGVNCGIMDQFAIGMGKKEHGILLNTATMDYHYAQLDLGHYALIISNTNKRRGLGDSKYNERRAECEAALEALNTVLDAKFLCDLDAETFENHKHLITDPIQLKRAKHVVMENLRTIKAHDELNAGNVHAFGQLMNASHDSLKEDFEVTGVELDMLVALAKETEGVLGSRMTGAGFGGCTVSLVEKDRIGYFIDTVGHAYKEKIGYDADFYVVEAGDGACELIK